MKQRTVMKKYRIVKIGNEYDAYFILQKRTLLFFWRNYVSDISKTPIRYYDIKEVKKRVQKLEYKPENKIVEYL
jgi:hypothetical protein